MLIRMTRPSPHRLPIALGCAFLAGWGPEAGAQPAEPAVRVALAEAHPAPAPQGPAGIAATRPKPRPPARRSTDMRCTGDGAYCIRATSYTADICRTIEALARANALDPGFFLRLIWRESRFDASAVSPKGARGIAQFMPGTADLRGLKDPFNPAEALRASAEYLAELARSFGNIGLAAVAYNAGERRAERFVGGESDLPLETRAYVFAITGHPALTWRDAPPETPDLSPDGDGDGDGGFQSACIARAEGRGIRAFRDPLPRWGVIVTSNISRDGAERQVDRLRTRYASVLGDETVVYSYGRPLGMRRPLHLAQIGRTSRDEADTLCNRLRAAGGACIVLRN